MQSKRRQGRERKGLKLSVIAQKTSDTNGSSAQGCPGAISVGTCFVDEFDPQKVARYTDKRIDKLTLDPSIIRNRMKIEAGVRNAREFLAIQVEFGSFDSYCWRFVDGRPRLNRWKTTKDIPATSPESDAFSKDLKKRGFNFVGSTIIYAHMQAVGMVNDHLVDCFR
jgi:DNA-3-methyladenine glycosylase I